MEATRDTKQKRRLAVTSSASTSAGGGVGLTDDLFVDILARVPVNSICRFKCVSPSWRNLISHPDNRKKLPQTLAGFFHFYKFDSCSFISLAEPPPPRKTGRGGSARPPLPCDFRPANTGGGVPRKTGRGAWARPPSPCDFLPAHTGGGVVDCCNGLVLLNNSCSGSDSEPHASYVVCNPATKKWTTVPVSTCASMICSASILCFDPAVSTHFHVVQLLEYQVAEDDDWYNTEHVVEMDSDEDERNYYSQESMFGFNIYSSQTGAWVYHPHLRNNHWSPVAHRSRRTFFNGYLHFFSDDEGGAVAALDMNGQTHRVIPVPQGTRLLIGHSQGHLFYANRDDWNASKLSIYVLGENGRSWTLKHCVDTSGLFADVDDHLLSGRLVGVAAVHPHGDSVFLFDSLQGRLMSYGLGSRRGHVICSIGESPLRSFVPYVPLYLEIAELGNSN